MSSPLKILQPRVSVLRVSTILEHLPEAGWTAALFFDLVSGAQGGWHHLGSLRSIPLTGLFPLSAGQMRAFPPGLTSTFSQTAGISSAGCWAFDQELIGRRSNCCLEPCVVPQQLPSAAVGQGGPGDLAAAHSRAVSHTTGAISPRHGPAAGAEGQDTGSGPSCVPWSQAVRGGVPVHWAKPRGEQATWCPVRSLYGLGFLPRGRGACGRRTAALAVTALSMIIMHSWALGISVTPFR